MGQTGRELDDDERALLDLLPADGSEASSEAILGRLGWDAERYARACVRLEERGYAQAGQGRAETAYRDLTAVPPEFRPACGRPGSRVVVRQVPVTVPHALHLPGPFSPPASPPDAHTLDVTIRVSGL